MYRRSHRRRDATSTDATPERAEALLSCKVLGICSAHIRNNVAPGRLTADDVFPFVEDPVASGRIPGARQDVLQQIHQRTHSNAQSTDRATRACSRRRSAMLAEEAAMEEQAAAEAQSAAACVQAAADLALAQEIGFDLVLEGIVNDTMYVPCLEALVFAQRDALQLLVSAAGTVEKAKHELIEEHGCIRTALTWKSFMPGGDRADRVRNSIRMCHFIYPS